MARAFPQSQPYDYGHDLPQGEWQALRGELVELLDQVETQVERSGARQERSYPGLAERMRALRQQVGDIEPDDRHREALRSVKRAVDRFTDRDEGGFETFHRAAGPAYAPNPRDTLQSAIQQIRSRQAAAPAPQRPQEFPQLEEMARAVGGVSGRLERLEAELKTQSQSQSGNVKAIADQVGQLSHVVELLAGAVGETGQVKRLEGQIASLATLVAQGPQVDLSALTQRLDDVSATVGRLADLQVQYAARVESPAEALRDGMGSIEQGVRNIYDRIDSLEKHETLAPETLERLTDEMARITEALHHPAEPRGLMEMIEGLTAKVSTIESRDSDVGGLRDDVENLRGAVVEAMEPRFAAIELQIEALSDRVAERPADPGIGQLEAQVRQLVARMDQTGEQLTGIARLQSQREPATDLEALADLVATRTSQAVAQTATTGTSSLSDDGLAEIEKRMSRAFEAAVPKEKAPDEFSGVRDSINEVNERLARLEASLVAQAKAAAAASPPPETTATAAPPTTPTMDDVRGDAMPASPATEAPLIDKPFAEMGPVRAALEAKNGPRKRHPGLGEESSSDPDTEAAQPGSRPAFDPASVPLPPRPQSSLDSAEPQAFIEEPPAQMPVIPPQPVATPMAPPASTNTFIAAARRAAQRQQTPQSAAASSSLMARALGNFRPGSKAEQPQESEKPAAAKPAKAAKPRKPTRAERKLAGDKDPQTPWTPDVAEPMPLSTPMPVQSAASIDGIGDHSGQPAFEDSWPRRPSFLRRHGKVILLGVSVVVLAMLTLNLVSQRLNAARTSAPAAATDGDTSALAAPALEAPEAAALAKAARVIPLEDAFETASIEAATATKFQRGGAVPAMPSAFVATTPEPRAAAAVGAMRPAPAAVAMTPLQGKTEIASEAAVMLELPPEGLGPEPLRQAAASGDPRAQFEIAAIYTEGRAVAEDLEAAAIWYERAAAQGFAPAQYRLGNLYENGRGVAKDLEQSRLWYQRAAEAGNRMSMHNLAALYAGGEMGEQAFDSAAEWFEQAAQRGLKDSQFNLGMLHARGLGVPQDLEQSYKWFSIAARNGDADAAKARDDVARSLDAEAVGRLDEEIESWKPKPIDLAANFAPIGTWSPTFDPGQTIGTKDVVKSVQTALAVLGYDIGVPDGLPGPKTAEAIRAFERATGMSESGAINPRLLAVLGSQPV